MSVLKLIGVLLDYPRDELWQHGLQLGSLIRIRFDVDEREQCAAKRLLVSLQPDAALSAGPQARRSS